MHFKNDMKNLPETEWIELRQKQKGEKRKIHLERRRRQNDEMGEKRDPKWKRWNEIFADDVSIVYTVMHRMWSRRNRWERRKKKDSKRNKNDYCLTSEKRQKSNCRNKSRNLLGFLLALQMFAEIKIKGLKRMQESVYVHG